MLKYFIHFAITIKTKKERVGTRKTTKENSMKELNIEGTIPFIFTT